MILGAILFHAAGIAGATPLPRQPTVVLGPADESTGAELAAKLLEQLGSSRSFREPAEGDRVVYWIILSIQDGGGQDSNSLKYDVVLSKGWNLDNAQWRGRASGQCANSALMGCAKSILTKLDQAAGAKP